MQVSFAKGELSPELRHRTDLAAYQIGADTIQNMIVLPRGGLQSRCGTNYIYETKDSADASRLQGFVFNTEQAYLIEFGDYYCRFYKDGGIILDDEDAIYEVITPYPIADVWDLKFEQSADTLFIDHPAYAPRMLTRTDHAAWTLSLCNFKYSPLMTENTTSTTITLSNAGSETWLDKDESVTVTASSALFNSGHVGSIWGIRYRAFTSSEVDYYADGTTYTSSSHRVIGDWSVTVAGTKLNMDNSPVEVYKSIDGGTTWFKIKSLTGVYENQSVEITGSEDDGIDVDSYLKVTKAAAEDSGYITIDISGKYVWAYFKITAVTSSTVATATMQQDFSRGGTAFTTWGEAAWSTYRGWPKAITFFQNRLMFGGNTYGPNTYWASCVDDYYNNVVSIPQVEDESITDRLPSRQVNAIEWLLPAQALFAFTRDSEWTIEPASTDGGFSYKSKITTQRSSYGCDETVKPTLIDDSAIFLQRNGTKVRALGYNDSSGYTSNDLSVMADHLFDGYTIKAWAYQQTPNSILWAVRSDGVLLSMTFHKEQQVLAWTHHTTDGLFEDVCCIPGDGQDDVYFIVNRTINGTAKRYIEMLAHRDVSSKSAFFGVDCGATRTSETASTSVTGLTWLEGEEVVAIGDGVYLGKYTVASGAITLIKAAKVVHVGLKAEYLFKSLPYGATGKNKIVGSATISVLNSQGGEVRTEDNTEYKDLQYPGAALYSGDLEDISLDSTWSTGGHITIHGPCYYPMHITAVMPQVTTS